MSDEETDSDEANSFVKRSPPWRSHKLDLLFKALDERYDLKNQTSLKRNRKTGMPSERPIPNGLPGWAKNTPSDESSDSLSRSSSPSNSQVLRTPTGRQLFRPISHFNPSDARQQTASPLTSMSSLAYIDQQLADITTRSPLPVIPQTPTGHHSMNAFNPSPDLMSACEQTPPSTTCTSADSGDKQHSQSTLSEAEDSEDAALNDWIQTVTGVKL